MTSIDFLFEKKIEHVVFVSDNSQNQNTWFGCVIYEYAFPRTPDVFVGSCHTFKISYS